MRGDGAPAALIGRRSELRRFRDLLPTSLDHSGTGFLWITGEAGCGKSRFVTACVEQAIQAGWEVLRGECTEETRSDPYGPFLSMLGLCFDKNGRLVNDRSVSSIVDQISLDAVFDAVADIPGMGIVAFGLKMGKTIFESRRRPQSSDELLNRNFEFIVQLFRQICAKRKKPLFLALDDLHLASATTCALVQYVLTRIEDARLLVLATWETASAEEGRQRVREALPNLSSPDHICHLDPLSDSQMRQLLHMCGIPVPDPLARALVEFSHGVPGLLVESLRLVHQGGGWEGEGVEGENGVGVPSTAIEALVARQLAQFSSKERALLECASLIGQRVPLSVLTAPPLRRYLGVSERTLLTLAAGLVTRGGVLGWEEEEAIRFVSPFVLRFLREQARGPLTCRDHLRIAEAWQTTGDELHPATLAHHFLAGRKPEKALAFALRSGEELSRSAAYPEAIQSYRMALEALDQLPDQEERVVTRYEILRAMGWSAEQTGDWGEASSRMEEALSCGAGDMAREAETHTDLGWLSLQRGEVQSALQHLDQSSKLYCQLEDAHGLARVDYYLGLLYGQQKEWQRAVECFQRYLAASETAGFDEGRASAYIELGNLYRLQQDWSQAERFLQQGIDLAQAEGDYVVLAQGYHHLGNCYARQGRADAIEMLQQALEIVRVRTKQPAQQARIQNTLAETLVRMNHWQEAESAFRVSAEIKERLGDRAGLAMTYGGLGRLYLRQWRFAEAVDYLQRDIDLLSHEFEANVAWIQQHTNSIGDARRLQGQLGEAERCFAQALELARRIPDQDVQRTSLGYTHMLIASLELDRNDITAAERECAWALEQLEGTWAEGEAQLTAARLARMQGNLGEARRRLDSALARIGERGEDVERALCYLEMARLYRDAGEIQRMREPAEQVVILAQRLLNVELERQADQLLSSDE